MWQWWNGLISGEIPAHINSTDAFLVEKAILARQGQLSAEGVLVVNPFEDQASITGKTFITRNKDSEKNFDWEKNSSISDEMFVNEKNNWLKRVHLLRPELFISERIIGFGSSYSLKINLITTSPVYMLALNHLTEKFEFDGGWGEFLFLHDHESTSISCINFSTGEIVLSGNIDFSKLLDILHIIFEKISRVHHAIPFDARLLINDEGSTLLVAGENFCRQQLDCVQNSYDLKGNFIHGIVKDGVFSLENGRTISSIEIKTQDNSNNAVALNHFASVVFNIPMDKDTRKLLIESRKSIDKGYAIFPFKNLNQLRRNHLYSLPENIFISFEDRLGVLPLIGKLELDQAFYFYVSTLRSVPGFWDQVLTFNDFHSIFDNNTCHFWLLNTGYFGGDEKFGTRYQMDDVRKAYFAVLEDTKSLIEWYTDPQLLISIPKKIRGIDDQLLNPSQLWTNADDYSRNVRDFVENFELFFENITKGSSHAFLHQEDSRLHGFK